MYPNPVSGNAVFEFFLTETATVRVDIYDGTGRKIDEIYNALATPGENIFQWSTGHLAPGMYYAVLSAGTFKTGLKIIKQ
jgi:hypothetical protein